jgi:hypothetical protein
MGVIALTTQATEPTTDAIVPPTDEDSAQQTAQAAAGASDVAADTGVGAAQFTFDSEEAVAQAIETNPQLRARIEAERKKAQDDGFNAGRQRRDKELRLERGNEAVARAWEQSVLRDHGVELDETALRDAPLWVQANREAERANYWRTNTEAVLDAFDARERDQITTALDGFEGNAEQMEQLGRQVYDTAVSRTTAKAIANLTLSDIPVNSTLHGDLRKHIEAEVAKEIEARESEARVSNAPRPPRTPTGGQATTKTRADYAALSQQQIADLPEGEYRIAMGYGAA